MHKRFIVLALILFTLSGCINFEVYQKIKRNGKYDLDFTISTTEEYSMVLEGLKETMQIHDSVKDKAEYTETDTSLKYSFKDLDPETDTKLFKKTNETIGDTGESPDTSFIDPDNVDFEKDFKFPNYEFTYTIKMQEPAIDEEPVTLTKEKNIIDEAGFIDDKDRLMEDINGIYADDAIEVVVITKPQMNAYDYFSFESNFTQSYDFAGDYYIIVFASAGDAPVCKVSTNIFLDTQYSNKIWALNTDFGANCSQDYNAQIQRIVSELYSYAQVNELETSNELTDSIAQMFKIKYTVEVFGNVIETNGEQLDDNKVQFEINPDEEGEYYIVFTDFFLATLFGDNWWVFISIPVVVILVTIVILVVKGKKPGKKQVPSQLADYIKNAKASGMNDDQIRQTLLQSGWQLEDINNALT